jgi:hypothetical protein
MKKSMVLAMAMAMGVTASAYAANPFSDVPAGHWAYDSVAKLAQAGVVDGYTDGQFDGNKSMTRYEMAQIVAKAMAKGANVDMLVAEFADELDTLGVRVENLEKKKDNVKITGQVRYSYADYSGDISDYHNQLRSRIWVNGQINDDWSYTGMFQNIQNFGNNEGDEKTDFQRAYFNGQIGGTMIEAGRLPLYLVNGNLYDTRADGVVLNYADKFKFTGFYVKPTDQNPDFAKFANDDTITAEYDKAYGVKVDGKIGNHVKTTLGYTVFKEGDAYYNQGWNGTSFNDVTKMNLDNDKIWNLGVSIDMGKNVNFTADYMRSNLDGFTGANGEYYKMDDDGLILGLNYKGAKASEPGSYGLYTKHYNQGRGTVIAHTMNGDYGTTGFKGYMVGMNYTLAKNMVGAIEWYDIESKAIGSDIGSKDMNTLWSQLMVTF